MTDAELQAIENRATAATPGPWQATGLPYNGTDEPCILTAQGLYIAQTVYDMQSQTEEHAVDADTMFIASARTDIPALIAEVRRLQGLLNP